ncbi:LysR family transcriptional regulator [Neobacillus sp. PS3-40]|uniref:LysR family transcriptional regulator n=1 Tax=Neobacillus sp. PS3-40 TaxID=3070679 RepID=UPI0027E17335|nr:LysR family transcriptional regulator [Neobacillus sp. PS3-40]WML44233.1 LysR family transcriptional regulator [Neobacillus sp. PS3-40]
MELRQLKYFIEVAKQEHISIAAETLHIAQSAVSRQISNLEAELGVQLLQREGRNIKLTHIGKLFAEQAVISLNAIANAKQLIDEYVDPERGTIRIGFPSSLASNTLPRIIKAFKKEHPDVRFHLRQGGYDFLIEGIKKREIDLAFIGPIPKFDSNIHSDILFTENFVALLPNNHLLADKETISLSQLEKERFILFPEGFILRKIVEDACLQAGFQPFIPCEGEDLDAIKGLVSAGIGITLLPELILYENIPIGTVQINIDEPKVIRTVGIITPKHRELSPSEQLFYDFVIAYFSKNPK